jgi:hypothetical protein
MLDTSCLGTHYKNMVNKMVNKRQVESARSMIGAISKPKEAKTMAKKATAVVKAENVTKAKADFKKVTAEKAKAHQTKRLEFIAKFGKVLAAAWAKEEKPTSMGIWRKVFPKAEEPCRLVDYTLVALGIRQSKDEGLLAWVKADKLGAVATSQPKARKETKSTKRRMDLGAAMSAGDVNV